LELAEHKAAKFPSMENVAIIEDWEYCDRVERWKYPGDLLAAFEGARIHLLVELAWSPDLRW
jgi:hypothetical protein